MTSPRGGTPVAVLKSPTFDRDADRLPYRIDHLRRSGFELRWTEAHRSIRPQVLARALRRAESATTPFVQTLALMPSIVRSPVTLAFFESEGNALGTLRTLVRPLRSRALVVLTCWLSELLADAASSGDARRRDRYRRAFRHADAVLCLARSQVAILSEGLDIDEGRIHVVAFGVDDERFEPARSSDGGYVIAVGRDRGRDWGTFFDSAALSGLPTKVLSRPADVAGHRVPGNVELLGYVGAEEYRALLAAARVSVIAAHDRTYPTGQTVLLESLALGKATVITRTAANADYVEPGTTALTVPVGDPASLAEATVRAYEDADLRRRLGRAGRAAIEQRFNAGAMWHAVARILTEVAR